MTYTINPPRLTAEAYIRSFGLRARAKVGDDISRAIGTHGWDEAHRLIRVLSSIRKAQHSDVVGLARSSS